jgi:hypothetical protein
MAMFFRDELELPVTPEWEEATGLDSNWTADYQEWPPLLARPPPAGIFPAETVTPVDSLYELLTEYVYRKYEVSANLMGSMPPLRRGTMPPTIWTKTRDIKRMSEVLKLPSLGWQQMYLLLSTLPAGWSPGATVEVTRLKNEAVARQQFDITQDQCRLVAYWLGSAEAMALCKVLYLEWRNPGDLGNPFNAQLGAGSLWMGGSACVCFPMKPSWSTGPESALRVLERAMAKWSIAHQHIEEECKVDDCRSERLARGGATNIWCQGYSSRIFDHAHNGLLGQGLTPPPMMLEMGRT